MKKFIVLMLSLTLVFNLAACGSRQSQNNSPASAEESAGKEADVPQAEDLQVDNTEEAGSSALEPVNTEAETEMPTEPENTGTEISQEPENVPAADTAEGESVKTLVAYFSWSSSGNTEKMANAIVEQTGGDIYEIIPVNPYPEEYDATTEVALEERDNNMRPEIQDIPDSIDEYDRILIGYPIWWHTAPMIIATFLENYDLTGVDVYPFTQSASMDEEQFENSMNFIRQAASGANVHDGLFAQASDTQALTDYLEQNGLTK